MNARLITIILMAVSLFSCNEEDGNDPNIPDIEEYTTDISFRLKGKEYFTGKLHMPEVRDGISAFMYLYNQGVMYFYFPQAPLYTVDDNKEVIAGVLGFYASQGEDDCCISEGETLDYTNGRLNLAISLFEENGEYERGLTFFYADGTEELAYQETPFNTYAAFTNGQPADINMSFNTLKPNSIAATLRGTVESFLNNELFTEEVNIQFAIEGVLPLFMDLRSLPDGSGAVCANLNYNGPTEGQAKQWCQYAQFLDCNGLITERDVQCQILLDYGATCPYCN